MRPHAPRATTKRMTRRQSENGRPNPHALTQTERTGHQDAVTKTHFQSKPFKLSGLIVNPCLTVSDNINTFLLQRTPNLLNILHFHTGNTDAAIDIAVTMLNDFELKRDAIQAKDDFPAQ